MHELAVTESVLRIALDAAEKNDAARVTDIYLTIGRLSSIVDDSVQFYGTTSARKPSAQGPHCISTARLPCCTAWIAARIMSWKISWNPAQTAEA